MTNGEKLKIHTEISENKCTVYLNGELDLSMAPEMRLVVDPLVEQSELLLALNLRDLTYIDSTGIGIIITILKTRDSMKAPFIVEEIPGKIKRLFDVTGITKFLPLT